MKFKVGDRVKLIKYNSYYASGLERKLGITGTILATDTDKGAKMEYAVGFDTKFHNGHECGGRCENGYGNYIYEEDLELLETDFKVGDRVKLIKSYDGLGVGAIGTIVHIPSNKEYLTSCEWDISKPFMHDCVGKAKSMHGYNVPIEHLELLTTEPPPAIPKEPKEVFTPLEIEILNKSGFSYIARDSNGLLFIYTEKPIIDIGGLQWYSSSYYEEIPKDLFKFIKWGSNPAEIKKLKGGK